MIEEILKDFDEQFECKGLGDISKFKAFLRKALETLEADMLSQMLKDFEGDKQ